MAVIFLTIVNMLCKILWIAGRNINF